MTASLKKYIARFESLQGIPSEEELRNSFGGLRREQLSIEEYICFSGTRYQRNVIHASATCELIALCFKPGQYTPIHDHGGSVGIAFVYKGTMTEELFEKQQSSGMIAPFAKNSVSANEVSCIDLSTIHRVSNVHDYGLVVLTVYFPPLVAMNIYNTENTLVEKWTAAAQRKQHS